MGKFLEKFFAKFGMADKSWFGPIRQAIITTLERIPGPGTASQKADAVMVVVLMGQLWAKLEELKGKFNEAAMMAEDGIQGTMCKTLGELTGTRPAGITKPLMEAWAGALVVSRLNDTLGTNVQTLTSAQDFQTLVQQMKNQVVNDLIAGGGEGGVYKIVSPSMARSLQGQVAQIANKAAGFGVRGMVSQLPLDREKMLNKIRQQRFRESHSIFYQCYHIDAQMDAILVQLEQTEAGLGVGLNGGN